MGLHYSVWIDVEDIFQYFEANSRPSGIQRLVYEILQVIRAQAARREAPMQIRLIRRQTAGTGEALFTPVSFEDLVPLFDHEPVQRQAAGGVLSPPPDGAAVHTVRPLPPPPHPVRSLRRALIQQLEAIPLEIGTPLLSIAVNQLHVLRLAKRYVGLRRRRIVALAPEPPAAAPAVPTVPAPPAAIPAADLPQSGDVFLILGAAWSEHGFGARLARMRATYGVEPVLLVYDLIPALRPEWCARSLIVDFRHWLDSTLPQCGRLLAISHATARSVEAYARDNGLRLLAPVQPIPIGSGFGVRQALGPRPPGLPPERSYVLFVSTVEARKNHMLAFVVWQRLLSEMPPQDVPTLVFAGREGWLVADLMQQIENTDWLRGKIRLLRDPTDEELGHLYDGCLFTLFPSLFEGWGLPVTESLINGAPCVASNATSIPEAGGALARYFDPENTDDAFRVVRETLADPDGIERWRQEVRTRFAPVPWQETADAVLDACDAAHHDRMSRDEVGK